MQDLGWDDLRFLLAVSRAGTFSAAARHLGVDDTTVSRRLRTLTRAAGVELFRRRRNGTLAPTPAGAAMAERAAGMELCAQAARQVAGEAVRRVIGTVRVTSVPVVVNRVLAPALAPLLAAHPDLAVELVPEARDLSLTRREADLAVRLGRPVSGGARVRARRIGMMGFGVFAAADVADDLPWIGYDLAMAHLPQAKWLAGAGRHGCGGLSGLRVADLETALAAVAGGLGKSLLPRVTCGTDPRVRELTLPGLPELPRREVWLLAHADQADFAHIRAVYDWIGGLRWDGPAARPPKNDSIVA